MILMHVCCLLSIGLSSRCCFYFLLIRAAVLNFINIISNQGTVIYHDVINAPFPTKFGICCYVLFVKT